MAQLISRLLLVALHWRPCPDECPQEVPWDQRDYDDMWQFVSEHEDLSSSESSTDDENEQWSPDTSPSASEDEESDFIILEHWCEVCGFCNHCTESHWFEYETILPFYHAHCGTILD